MVASAVYLKCLPPNAKMIKAKTERIIHTHTHARAESSEVLFVSLIGPQKPSRAS